MANRLLRLAPSGRLLEPVGQDGGHVDTGHYVGIRAALASTASFAPQPWRVIQTRDTKAISLPSYALTVLAFGLWLSYGFIRSDWAIMAPNAICLMLASFILLMKLLPRKEKAKLADAIEGIKNRNTS